jgi:hypothetical protein
VSNRPRVYCPSLQRMAKGKDRQQRLHFALVFSPMMNDGVSVNDSNGGSVGETLSLLLASGTDIVFDAMIDV